MATSTERAFFVKVHWAKAAVKNGLAKKPPPVGGFWDAKSPAKSLVVNAQKAVKRRNVPIL